MPIDTSMYAGARGIDLGDAIEKGMSIRDMMDTRAQKQKALADQEAVNGAYGRAYTVDDKGNKTLDQGKLTSELAGLNSAAARQEQQNMQQQQSQSLDFNLKKAHATADLAQSVNSPEEFQSALAQGKQMGLDMGQVEKMSFPEFMAVKSQIVNRAMSVKDKLELDARTANQNENRAEKKWEHGIKNKELNLHEANTLAQNFKKDLDPDAGRTGNFGQISAKVQAADRLKTLVDAYKGGDLPPAQMEELALGMSNMLAGSGGASRAQVEALVPHTWYGGTQKAAQWLLNEPQGAGQQKFVEQMAHTIERERETANKQLNDIRAKRLSAHERFRQIAPEQYGQMLQSYGLDPSRVKNGQYVPEVTPPAQAQAAGDAPKILKGHEIEWAD